MINTFIQMRDSAALASRIAALIAWWSVVAFLFYIPIHFIVKYW